MFEGPILETQRLLLRVANASDFDAFATMNTEVGWALDRSAQGMGSSNSGPGKLQAPFENEPIEIWSQTREQWQARRAAKA